MPTPVSALIHAATMVTAGVYLLMRSSPLIEFSSTVLLLCLWLGAITTVFSSLVGLFQQDIKKVIAFSTMSQLGMMVIAVGLSSYNLALFHLINHAFAPKIIYSCTILNNNTYLIRELLLVLKRLEFLVSNIWHLIWFYPSLCYCSQHCYAGFNYRFLYEPYRVPKFIRAALFEDRRPRSGINKTTFGTLKTQAYPCYTHITLRKISGVPSTLCYNEDNEFYDWFSGFSDAEGSFIFGLGGGLRQETTMVFTFSIGLHIDDGPALKYIQERLGIGKLYTSGVKAIFQVRNREGIHKLIDIFTRYPLKTTKYLNFLAFKEAFYKYTNAKKKSPELIAELLEIKGKMNTQRTNFSMPNPDTVIITKNWLLGFLEGDGSFIINKAPYYALHFKLTQSNIDLYLMEKIKNFFDNSAGKEVAENIASIYSITEGKNVKNKKPILQLIIPHQNYILNILIPQLDSMKFHTKKSLDYLDWRAVAFIKNLGLHYTKEGIEVIELILSQMNNSRLSTNKNSAGALVDRILLYKRIENLLSGPSNFTLKQGKLLIISDNRIIIRRRAVFIHDAKGLVINQFNSQAEAAKILGLNETQIAWRLNKGKSYLTADKRLIFLVAASKEDNLDLIISENLAKWEKSKIIAIKDQQTGLILNKFDTLKACAEYLGITKSRAEWRLKKGTPHITCNNKIITIVSLKKDDTYNM